MSIKFLTTSPAQTQKIGKKLAKDISRTPPLRGEARSMKLSGKPHKIAVVLGLVGDLGGGKTTFLQGFARGLGIKEKILSPTFIIVRRIRNFYHIDCYRIKKPRELLDLGFKRIISDPRNIVAIEWADRIKKIMPPKTIWLDFEFVDDKTRKIIIK